MTHDEQIREAAEDIAAATGTAPSAVERDIRKILALQWFSPVTIDEVSDALEKMVEHMSGPVFEKATLADRLVIAARRSGKSHAVYERMRTITHAMALVNLAYRKRNGFRSNAGHRHMQAVQDGAVFPNGEREELRRIERLTRRRLRSISTAMTVPAEFEGFIGLVPPTVQITVDTGNGQFWQCNGPTPE